MEELNFKILRLLEKEGPKTTQQISEAMGKSRYSIEKRLFRLNVRELQSKVHGPSVWWIPSLYEYMLRVAESRLIKAGFKPHIGGKLDFYGEGEYWIGGICTNILDKEGIEKEIEKEDRVDKIVILTESPPAWDIDDVEIWTLSDDLASEGVSLIPVKPKIAERLRDMSDKDFVGFCTKIVEKGIEAKRWGL